MLIITESTQISQEGKGYGRTPGIYTKQQRDGWRLVTQAVHNAGGRIFLQLWHVGRVSHPIFHEGQPPVAPSALQPRRVRVYTFAPENGELQFIDCVTPGHWNSPKFPEWLRITAALRPW